MYEWFITSKMLTISLFHVNFFLCVCVYCCVVWSSKELFHQGYETGEDAYCRSKAFSLKRLYYRRCRLSVYSFTVQVSLIIIIISLQSWGENTKFRLIEWCCVIVIPCKDSQKCYAKLLKTPIGKLFCYDIGGVCNGCVYSTVLLINSTHQTNSHTKFCH